MNSRIFNPREREVLRAFIRARGKGKGNYLRVLLYRVRKNRKEIEKDYRLLKKLEKYTKKKARRRARS